MWLPKDYPFCDELNVVNVECMDFREFQGAQNNQAERYPPLCSLQGWDICDLSSMGALGSQCKSHIDE